jgi:heavy metal translocating P-type ATPase
MVYRDGAGTGGAVLGFLRKYGEVLAAGLGLAAAAVSWAAGQPEIGRLLFALTAIYGAAAALFLVVVDLVHRRLGVDIVALLALVGALGIREYLAGAVITLMLTGGRALEAFAAGRAERELRLLVERTPRLARVRRHGGVETIGLDAVRPGDVLLVATAEIVPVDGILLSAAGTFDESALTGEPLPVTRSRGSPVASGVVNAASPIDLEARATAADSTYARVVDLVQEAHAHPAPFVRLADRYAAAFVGLALAGAGAAWLFSGDIVRAVAVLVIATPCPLILAVPIALVGGLSRAAQRGVIIKGGGVLEALGTCPTLLIDKTGTLTRGHPTVSAVVAAPGFDLAPAIRAAGALEQVSQHVVAQSISQYARLSSPMLPVPDDVEETPGAGIAGRVDAHAVRVGTASFVGASTALAWVRRVRRQAESDGALAVFVGMDGVPVGALLLHDPIRPDSAHTLRLIRTTHVRRIVMVTGDREETAAAVAAILGLDDVKAECSPEDKMAAVRIEQGTARTIMVGDGINDAPALAVADVGIAVGIRGASSATETADAVLLVDSLERVHEALVIARRTVRIARDSVLLGMGLSIAGMAAAALGLLPPLWGAIAQEGIDVLAILNALRSLTIPVLSHRRDPAASERAIRFTQEHADLWDGLDALREAADGLVEEEDARAALVMVRRAEQVLRTRILPHERGEERELYPALAALYGDAVLWSLRRTHGEIIHLSRRLARLLDAIDAEEPDPVDVAELRRSLYALHAILRLHTAEEEEEYAVLVESSDRPMARTR